MRPRALTVPVSAALLAALAGCAGSGGDACPIPGEAAQWRADYCLFVSGTDDVIAAQPCMDEQAPLRFRDTCSEKRYYKRSLCTEVVQAGARTGTVQQCFDDPAFSGTTVRDGGT